MRVNPLAMGQTVGERSAVRNHTRQPLSFLPGITLVVKAHREIVVALAPHTWDMGTYVAVSLREVMAS